MQEEVNGKTVKRIIYVGQKMACKLNIKSLLSLRVSGEKS